MGTVGQIVESEKKDMLNIYEKINALNELQLSIKDYEMDERKKQQLINKINNDINQTEKNFLDNWLILINKYKWKVEKNNKLKLDFNTNLVYII